MVYGMDAEFSRCGWCSCLMIQLLKKLALPKLFGVFKFWVRHMWNCTFNLPEKLQMVKVMSSNTREVIPDLNSPFMDCDLNTNKRNKNCVLNTMDMEIPIQDVLIDSMAPFRGNVNHANNVVDTEGAIVPADAVNLLSERHGRQEEIPARDACLGFTAPISRDGAIVPPADTENLLPEKHGHQEEMPARDACIGFTAPISRDGAIFPPADTESLLSEKHGRQEEIPARDACIGFTASISRDGAIVPPADAENLLSEKHRHQEEIPARDACIGFTAPIIKDGAIVPPADTENLLSEKHGHQEEIPARNACIGFTAPISRDGAIVPPADTENLFSEKHGIGHQEEILALDACIGFTAQISREVGSGVAEVAGAADNEKLLFEKRVHLWELVESSDAFKKMPQDPHFLPLKSCKEVLREGQALGRMVIFDTIANETLKFNLDTKREDIEDNLSRLEELETYGFDGKILKDRMKRLLMLKNEEEKFKKMSEQRNRMLSGHVQEYYKFEEIRAKAEERIKELQNEVELAFKTEKDMDAKKASVLEEDRVYNEKRRRINMEMEEIMASPLQLI